MKHSDYEPVLVSYSSDRNITFHGEGDEIGYTWGEWRAMDELQRADALDEYLWSIVNVYVQDEEDE